MNIKALALRAGLASGDYPQTQNDVESAAGPIYAIPAEHEDIRAAVEEFAALVLEEAAKVCETSGLPADDCADAIRALKTPQP